jgi:DinB superfamily
MEAADILVDAFGRIREIVHQVVDGQTPRRLAFRVDSEANSIAWLVWHLTRIQDDHVAEVAQTEQVWTSDGWSQRFGLPFVPSATGYGHNSDDVAAVQVRSAELLTGYHDAVHDMTIRYVEGLTDADFERIVDRSWDPPVTLAVRLVSVLSDDLQHAGQAAFIAGVLSRRPGSGA